MVNVQPFIRYYINQVPYPIGRQIEGLLNKLPCFQGWQWISIGNFKYKDSRGYLPGNQEGKVESIRRWCEGVIEHHDPDAVIGSSLIWSSRATVVDDLLTLCSIAESKHIHAIARESLFADGTGRFGHSLSSPLPKSEGIIQREPSVMSGYPDENLKAFVTDGLAKLREIAWKKQTGFIPAIHWYAQAQRSFGTAPSSLEVSLYWIVLEVLARAYVYENGLASSVRKKDERVKRLVSEMGFKGSSWDFINVAIDDWYELRCCTFHEGDQPAWPEAKFEQRWRQIAEFVSFVLADLLQPQSQSHKDSIGTRLSAY